MSESLYDPTIQTAASTYGVPPNLLEALIGQESSFNPTAQNGDAYGLGQFIPSTAAQYGVDVTDPTSSINGAAYYLSTLQQQLGSWGQAVEAYGTVPSTGAVTAGQQATLAAAQQADAAAQQAEGGLFSGGTFVPNNEIPAPGATPGTLSTTRTAAGGPMNTGSSILAWLESSMFRVGIGVICIIFLILGLGALVFNKSPAQTVSAVRGSVGL